jgi:hypothetical protein
VPPAPSPSPTSNPQSTKPQSTNPQPPNPSSTIIISSNNTGAIVGSVIGSLFGGILLTVGSFFLYKRYKNKKEQNNAIPTPGEGIQFPGERTAYYQNQLAPPQPIYNHGQEPIPISGNVTQQNIDQNALQTLVTQTVREEMNNLRYSQFK